MEQSVAVDGFKVMHWLNARKLTLEAAARTIGIPSDTLNPITQSESCQFPADLVEKLALCLNVEAHQISADNAASPQIIVMKRREIEATRRAIYRDGIHFYNYYSLPSPKGKVGPVILDILCPKGRLPKLNNGHLEPAITVNIGPGDIYGRWGEDLTDDTWNVLAANKTGREPWILGDSYTEPSYCRHTYSLVADERAQIISYTVKSNLEGFLNEANAWSARAFDTMLEKLCDGPAQASIMTLQMGRRGFSAETLAETLSLSRNAILGYLAGDSDSLSVADLRAIGTHLGVDYRLFLPAAQNRDRVGKTFCSVANSLSTIRRYQSYTVASMASAPTESDLVGLFMRVDKSACDETPDLTDHGPSHYLTTRGKLSLHVCTDEERQVIDLEPGDAVWLGPFVPHAFFGQGALAKLGNGAGSSYLDQIQLSNTFDPRATLKQGRRNLRGWGYD
ncbi:MAG TPA: histidine kinase [Stellaceae bacterium]|nr:histidine kinase [Stellaceae bacterium]